MLSPSNRVSPGQQGVSKVSDTLGPALVLDTDAVLEIVGQAAQWSENGVIVFDPSGNCQWVNHSSSRSLGPGEEASLVGRLNLWEHCFIPEDPQQRKLEEALNGRYVEVPELHYHPTGGGAPAVTGEDFSCPSDCFKVSAQLFPLLDLGGKPVALYVFNSASPNPEAEGDARFASEPHLAQTIQVAKRFSRKTAHDFNNITAVVQGFASILLNRLPKDDANRNLVEQIEASAQDALKLTSWLSGFANVRPAEPVEVDFNGMVQEFLAVCRDQKPENVELKVDLASQLPGVLADESHLEEVLRHLWQNSVEALAEGGTLQWQTSLEPLPDPTAQGVDRCSPASYLRLRVKDTGVGMEQPTLQAMLEPFFSTKPGKNPGFGLGRRVRHCQCTSRVNLRVQPAGRRHLCRHLSSHSGDGSVSIGRRHRAGFCPEEPAAVGSGRRRSNPAASAANFERPRLPGRWRWQRGGGTGGLSSVRRCD